MNSTRIIIALAAFALALFIMLLIQRKISASKYEALAVELDQEQILRMVEIEVNSAIINLKDQEIIKLKRQLAASEKLRKELSEKRWEEEALG